MSSSDSAAETECSEFEGEKQASNNSDSDLDSDASTSEKHTLTKTLDSHEEPDRNSDKDSGGENRPGSSITSEDEIQSEVEMQDVQSISSSTSEEGKNVAAFPRPTTPRRTFSLQKQNASAEILKFLRKVGKFWTRSHNLRRGSAPITSATYDKVKERISCK